MKKKSVKMQALIGGAIAFGSTVTLFDRVSRGEGYVLPAISLALGLLAVASAVLRARRDD